jgi:hypothetical protein
MRKELAIGHYLLPQIIQQAILNHRWVLRVVPSLFAYAHCLTAFINRSSTPSTVSSEVLSSNFPVLYRLVISDLASEFSSSFIPRNIRDPIALPSAMFNFCRQSNLRITVHSRPPAQRHPHSKSWPLAIHVQRGPGQHNRLATFSLSKSGQPWITEMKRLDTTNGIDTTT